MRLTKDFWTKIAAELKSYCDNHIKMESKNNPGFATLEDVKQLQNMGIALNQLKEAYNRSRDQIVITASTLEEINHLFEALEKKINGTYPQRKKISDAPQKSYQFSASIKKTYPEFLKQLKDKIPLLTAISSPGPALAALAPVEPSAAAAAAAAPPRAVEDLSGVLKYIPREVLENKREFSCAEMDNVFWEAVCPFFPSKASVITAAQRLNYLNYLLSVSPNMIEILVDHRKYKDYDGQFLNLVASRVFLDFVNLAPVLGVIFLELAEVCPKQISSLFNVRVCSLPRRGMSHVDHFSYTDFISSIAGRVTERLEFASVPDLKGLAADFNLIRVSKREKEKEVLQWLEILQLPRVLAQIIIEYDVGLRSHYTLRNASVLSSCSWIQGLKDNGKPVYRESKPLLPEDKSESSCSIS